MMNRLIQSRLAVLRSRQRYSVRPAGHRRPKALAVGGSAYKLANLMTLYHALQQVPASQKLQLELMLHDDEELE